MFVYDCETYYNIPSTWKFNCEQNILLYLASYEHGCGNQYDKMYFIIVNV